MLSKLVLKLYDLLLLCDHFAVQTHYLSVLLFKFLLLCLKILADLLKFAIRFILGVSFLGQEVFVLINSFLSIFNVLVEVCFLTTLTLNVRFVLLDKPLFLLNDEIFFFYDGLQTLLVFAKRLNLFVFVPESHFSL